MSKENEQDVLGGEINSTTLNKSEESFREGLKVQPIEQPITPFPTDEEILCKMDKINRMYMFNTEDIDRKIKITNLTKSRRTTISVS